MIGNPIVSTDFPVNYFSGNGSTTAFTLSIAPASVNAIDVQVSGVSQSPQTYTVSGTTLTFSAAPPTGSSNIVVRHLGIAGIPNVPSAGSVVNSSIADATITAAKFATGQTPTFNGITFPATQVASADANTLDDYEEGTWTPTVRSLDNNASVTVTVNNAWYVKVGGVCSFSCYITVAVGSVGTNALVLGGLPFSSIGGYVAFSNTHDTLSGSTGQGFINATTTDMYFINANATSSVPIAGTGTKYCMVSGTYRVA